MSDEVFGIARTVGILHTIVRLRAFVAVGNGGPENGSASSPRALLDSLSCERCETAGCV